jgi:hypothetical protein
MSVPGPFLEALDHPNALQALREVASTSLREGATQAEVLDALEQVRAQIRTEGRDADEDKVLELMDMVGGWSAPHMKL